MKWFLVSLFCLEALAASLGRSLFLTKIDTARLHLTKWLEDVMNTSTCMQGPVMDQAVIVNVMQTLLSHMERLHDFPDYERLHHLIDVVILHSEQLGTLQSAAFFQDPFWRVNRGDLWTYGRLKQVETVFARNPAFKQILISLLQVKEALGIYRGWKSCWSHADDDHDRIVMHLVARGLLFNVCNDPVKFKSMAFHAPALILNDLMQRKATRNPAVMANLLSHYAKLYRVNLNLNNLHPDIVKEMETISQQAANSLMSSERPKQRKKRNKPNTSVQRNIDSSPASGLLLQSEPLDNRADELDSDDEGVHVEESATNEVYQISKPSTAWLLYAKVVKAQHCRTHILIPLRSRIQKAAVNFSFTSWEDLPRAPEYDEHLGDFTDEEVKKCIRIVTERNKMVHNGSLLKYLHDLQEVSAFTGFPSHLIQELFQHNPMATESILVPDFDFKSHLLSERNCKRSIFILALYFIIDQMVPVDLRSRYQAIISDRRRMAHPYVSPRDTNLVAIDEHLL